MPTQVLQAMEQVLWGCNAMCNRGYVLGTAGNISSRVTDEDLFVITPTSMPYEDLKADDLVVVDLQGNVVQGHNKPSIEVSMHRIIFEKRPEVQAIVHTHSKFATAVGSLYGVKSVPALDVEGVLYLGGDLAVAPFAPPGSSELAANVVQALGATAGVIMENHGAVGVGTTMKIAMIASDNVERMCEMYIAVLAAGKYKALPEDYYRESVEKSLKLRNVVRY